MRNRRIVGKRKVRPTTRGLKIKQKLVASLEAELLRRVRAQGGVSRVDLARQLQLAPSTAGAYVDRLISEGFLFEQQKATRNFGRPPTLLALNPGGGRFVGVDFEAQNIMASLVDFSQQPIQQVHETIHPGDTAEQVVAKIESIIDDLVRDCRREILGIGVGVPGIIDPKKQVALHYSHIPNWTNVPLGERLTKKFKVDVFLENNIRSMALAELWFGQGRSLDDFICLGIRTGIGAGVVVGRRVLHGKRNLAGEIGDWLCPVGLIGRPGPAGLHCEELRPLEGGVSVPAILRGIRTAVESGVESNLNGQVESLGLEQAAEAARAGDPAVVAVLKRAAETLGWAVVEMDALFNPQKIILAGLIVSFGDALLKPLHEAVERFCSKRLGEKPVVSFSELGSFNGALGAAALAMHEWKPKR